MLDLIICTPFLALALLSRPPAFCSSPLSPPPLLPSLSPSDVAEELLSEKTRDFL